MIRRPRNRQGRQARSENPRRGNGGNHSRGGADSFRGRHRTDYPANIPSIIQVVPNAPVSIVLKMDQSTGREVQGIVQEVLTSGNHPRGIKVKLQDGRVGRVQRLVSEQDALAASQGLSGLGRDGEVLPSNSVNQTPRHFHNPYSDVRDEETPIESLSLEDYIKPAKRGRRGRPRGPQTGDPSIPDTEEPASFIKATCPICGVFEGDEAAVSHHVESHFSEGG